MLARIALEGVNLHLAGRPVLHDISWSLQPSEHWAFIGSNGSGKSTLLRVMAGSQWIDYDGGTRAYSPDGVRRDALARAATWIRTVSSEAHERYARLDLALSGREIVASGFTADVYPPPGLGPEQQERVEALVGRLDLQTFATRAVRELSSGQIRRLLIARALVSEPRVLILDEFTNGLDAGARREILTLLDRLADSVSLIVASHRAADFPQAITHTATLAGGRMSTPAAGRPLLRRSEPRRRSLTLQPSGATLLTIRNADVYRGDTLVLRAVDFDLRTGEHTIVRGANGAGKSTFAGLIAGTIPAATGAHIVRFGKREPFDVWQLKKRIAHVSDDVQIAYDRGETVAEVVASGFPASIGLFRPASASERNTVDELISRIGLESLRERSFNRLSFGERRKVLIARSLIRRPAVFILDEIWNGLDETFRAAFHTLLAEMTAAGTTVVAIAHDDDDDALPLGRRAVRIEGGILHEETLRR